MAFESLSEDPDHVENSIVSLSLEGKWRTILTDYQANKLLPWLWPSIENLQFIAEMRKDFNASNIVSIGCGSGLFEWLLSRATGVPVKGVEVDRSWWISKHCRHVFIPLEYAEDFTVGFEAASVTDIIMFCYFNNERAFLSYMEKYSGPCLIIIGPGEARGTHTAPNPFDLPLEISEEWTLHALQEMHSGNDYIAVFQRRT